MIFKPMPCCFGICVISGFEQRAARPLNLAGGGSILINSFRWGGADEANGDPLKNKMVEAARLRASAISSINVFDFCHG